MTHRSAALIAWTGLMLAWAWPAPTLGSPVIESWVSSQDAKLTLTRRPDVAFDPDRRPSSPGVKVDRSRRFQTLLGFGSSLEPTTCYNISRLAPDQQDEVIRRLVDRDRGIGMNLMRICIGTPDFTGDPWYTYDDMPEGQTDEQLEHFSIDKDRRYILPIIKKARRANPDLLFFASPWSPPGWMTSTGDMIGGHLLPKYYDAYARYFVRFIQAYQAEGIPIYAVTIQNEPGVDRSREKKKWRYPSCRWTGEQERDFIRDHLGPALKKAGLTTKIWSYDHNFNVQAKPGDAGIDYPTAVLRDPKASRFVDGVAFHGYEGKPAGMSVFHERFPDVPIHFSEGSVFGVIGSLQLMSYLRNWACSYNAWVTMIDEKRGPNNGPFRASLTCLMLDSATKKVTYRNDYYLYGQFMKFVRRGAVRVGTSGSVKAYQVIAFENPDGQIVLIVANPRRSPQRMHIRSGSGVASVSVPPVSVATFVWKPD